MRNITKITLLTLAALLLLSMSVMSKPRKLPVGAYIKSAKIDIISGDIERYEQAIAMLDSLFMYYGPHAEALDLMASVMVDYIDKTPDLHKRMDYVKKLVAYNDSLHICCNSKDVKGKYKKGCDEFVEMQDSIKVKYWREFYNSAVEQLKNVTEKQNEINAESDSAVIEIYQTDLDAIVDSCNINLQMCIILDSTDEKSYVGLGSLNDKLGNYEEANKWYILALDKTEEQQNIIISIAYNYYNLDDHCNAAKYMQKFIDKFAAKDSTSINYMENLVVFYNNCGNYDKGLAVNRQILEIDPNNFEALKSIGHYFNQMYRTSNDSTTAYRQAENEEKTKEWQAKGFEYIDSSLVYYGLASKQSDTDEVVWGLYATYLAIRERWEEAAPAFAKLTELQPNDSRNWIYYGDCSIRLERYDDAIAAYEKAAELDPNDKETWHQLAALYEQVGNTAKKTEAEKKAAALGN